MTSSLERRTQETGPTLDPLQVHADPDAVAVEAERRRLTRTLAVAYRLFARFGLDEGAAGHITVRDPLNRDEFWVAPFGRWFGGLSASDMLRVNGEGEIVAGLGSVNRAAFCIHAAIHEARPEVNGVAHAHGLYGKAFASLPRLLAPLTQDSCAFYARHTRMPDFEGVVLDRAYGDKIARSLGPDNRALILANHGHLTAADSLEAAVWWFIAMERSFQAELIARAADVPVEIGPAEAELTATQHTVEYAELCFGALRERMEHEQPELLG